MQSEEVDENEKQVLIIFITMKFYVISEGISENFIFFSIFYLNTRCKFLRKLLGILLNI